MTLTPEQKQAVSSWVAAGDSLSTVQKKLSEQFKVSLTYMDVRFLVDDLGLELKNAAPKPAPDVASAGHGAGTPPSRSDSSQPPPRAMPDTENAGFGTDDSPADSALPPEDEGFPEDGLPPESAGTGSVTVDIDRIVRPGAVASGTVTFSDGVSGKWALDQYGRLMLETGQKGYQPPASDVQAFQRELSMQLQRQGY